MSDSPDNRIYKVLVVILILLLTALAIWSYSTFNENEDIKEAITEEKNEIKKELENISADYSLQIEKGTVLSNDLEDARMRITRLVDSVNNLKGDAKQNVRLLSSLRKELIQIKKERDELQNRVATLLTENSNLTRVNDSTLQVLNAEMIKSTSQKEKIKTLNDDMSRAAALIPVNFETTPLIIRGSGKQIENDRASRVDALNTCFTLPKNTLAQNGVSSYYLQIVNPLNNVMGAGKKVQFPDQELSYSKIVQFNYKGEELKICELVELLKEDRESGTYRINLYKDAIRIASQELVLR
jgi:Ca2+/Na+ antiporter